MELVSSCKQCIIANSPVSGQKTVVQQSQKCHVYNVINMFGLESICQTVQTLMMPKWYSQQTCHLVQVQVKMEQVVLGFRFRQLY